MREIKFRVYVKHLAQQMHIIDPWDSAATFREYVREGAPVMQFTGLKDKNAKEIYEGDVVRTPDDWELYGMAGGTIYQVRFSGGGFRASTDPRRGQGYWMEDGKDFEVIGNIYENPELLV